MVLTDQLAWWTADGAWLRDLVSRLGFPARSLSLEVHGVARSWRVSLGLGAELEVTLADLNWASTQPLDDGTKRVVSDGMQSLVDKDGRLLAVKAAVLTAN
jgi:hypothetical protein